MTVSNNMFKFAYFVGILVAVLISNATAQNDGTTQTWLDEFVYSEESLSQFSFTHISEQDWSDVDEHTGIGFTAIYLNMTSGNWRTEEEVGIRSNWWHILILIKPDNLNPAYASHAGVYVTGKKNDDNDGLPDLDNEDIHIITTMATGIGMPFAALFEVPNAYITFANDPLQMARKEDEIIAYTFDKFLNEPSRPELLAYPPMVRAAVRSLDAITEFSRDNFETTIEKYIVSGNSKRGWTSWLTGAVASDKVEAIVPVVWDGINVQEVFHRQYRDYGGWSFAINDYIDNHVVERIDTPEMAMLQDLIDPYFYRTRLTMPKLVVTGLMDEFQMPDDEEFWWDELPSPKWLLKNPNTEHSMQTGFGVWFSVMGTWITYLLNGWEIPFLTWEYDEVSGDVTVHTHGGEVLSAQLWSANSCHAERRDFRVASLDDPCECGVLDDGYCFAFNELWHNQTLDANPDGTYTGHVDPLDDGRWKAFVVTVQFTTEHNIQDESKHNFFTRGGNLGSNKIDPQPRWPVTPPGIFEFTSRGSIVPNTYPFDDCTQESCAGELV